jgi:hypothetical protein
MKIELIDILRRRPAVHQLCQGIFIQEPVWLSDTLLAVPLKALGFTAQAHFTAQYAVEVAGVQVDSNGRESLVVQGKDSLPIISITHFWQIDAPVDVLEKLSEQQFTQARRVLGWTSGDEITPMSMLTCTLEQSFFRLLLPHSRRGHRLGFGNTGVSYHSQISQIYQASRSDEHFDFALSLLHDALQEANPQFKIARLFNCLECLACKLKGKHGGKSRRAVKDLLGLEDGAMTEEHINGMTFRYDAIEIAGRLRDKLFHGVMFRAEDLNEESRCVFTLLESNPQNIVASVLGYCELEIARWANGSSRGLILEPD